MHNLYTLDQHRSVRDARDGCDHRGRISTEFGAVRCADCLSQLVMVPHHDGEFRLEWLSPARMAIHSCAA